MSQTAIVAGVGPGLGESLVRKFAREGCHVGLLARSADYIRRLAENLETEGVSALPVATDITKPEQVREAFQRIRGELGPADIFVHHAGNASWKEFTQLDPEEFERSWRVCAYGGFLCCQQVVPDMIENGKGAILFTGATSAIRGRGGALAFSSAKFAVRGFAWSLARELGPKGIHVAHVIIDGILDTPTVRDEMDVAEEPLLKTDAVADVYWDLIRQDRSSWTFELDVRPHNEEFFT